MILKEIDILKEEFNPFTKIGNDWFLITAGDESGFNTMTASWGFMGIMWNKNVVSVVLRPQRYTKEFVDKSDCFTISFFDKKYKKALGICGSKSGREIDKVKETGLTPVFIDGTTTFEEAELTIVCKKIYADDIKENCFIDKSLVETNYPNKDFHMNYLGEVIKAYKK